MIYDKGILNEIKYYKTIRCVRSAWLKRNNGTTKIGKKMKILITCKV